MATETARIAVMRDGARIAYRVSPARLRLPGRAVVLLHGVASNLTRWSAFMEHTALVERWDVIRVDLRGHGDSATRGRIGLEIWADDLATILDLAEHPRAVVVGHSLGAQVALHFGHRHRQRALGLVLIDPVFREALRGRMRRLAQLASLLRMSAGVVRALNAVGLRRARLPPLDLRELDERARAALQSPGGAKRFIASYSSPRADLRHFRTAHYLQELAELGRPLPLLEAIDIPVLILLSRGVTFTDPDRTRSISTRLRHADIVPIDAYHWPLTERPTAVREAIERWCESLPIATAS